MNPGTALVLDQVRWTGSGSVLGTRFCSIRSTFRQMFTDVRFCLNQPKGSVMKILVRWIHQNQMFGDEPLFTGLPLSLQDRYGGHRGAGGGQ